MIKLLFINTARCLKLGILAFSFLSAQSIGELELQYLWKTPHNGELKVVEIKIEEGLKNRSLFFNGWSPENPNRFYHSFSRYSKKENEFAKLMSAFRNESVFIQKQYNSISRELMIESSQKESIFKVLALDSLYNEEALWVIVPEMIKNNIPKIKVWILPTLSNYLDVKNEGIYSELVLTKEKFRINDIDCIKVNWIYKKQTLGIYVSSIGIPKIVKLELPDLSLFELKKMDLKIQN